MSGNGKLKDDLTRLEYETLISLGHAWRSSSSSPGGIIISKALESVKLSRQTSVISDYVDYTDYAYGRKFTLTDGHMTMIHQKPNAKVSASSFGVYHDKGKKVKTIPEDESHVVDLHKSVILAYAATQARIHSELGKNSELTLYRGVKHEHAKRVRNANVGDNVKLRPMNSWSVSQERGIEFWAINKDYPEENGFKNNNHFSRKIKADIFIDDRNIGGLPDWGQIYPIS